MMFFKRKKSPEIIKTSAIDQEKARLTILIAKDVDEQLTRLSDENMLRLIELKRKQLIYLYPDVDDYKYELLKKIIFYLEVRKELQYYLAELLRGNSPDYDVKKIKHQVDAEIEEKIAIHYEQFFKKYLSSDGGIKGLEKEFIEALILYEWMKALIPFYRKNPYETIDELPKRWIARTIESECRRKADELVYF